MNQLVKAIKESSALSFTQNGDITYSTSLDACVDFFFKAAAARTSSEAEVIGMFKAAFKQDSYVALRTLLWLRDVREGAGERRVFRVIANWLSLNEEAYASLIMNRLPELGRYDDLLYFTGMKDQVLEVFSNALRNDDTATLAAKWAPKERSKKNKIWARALASKMEMSPKAYRRMLSYYNSVVETDMCAKKWSEIEYGKLPSKASANYTKAFTRNDPGRYAEYLEALEKGDEKVNAGAIFPYDVIKISNESLANSTWKALPDFVPEDVSFMPMIDTSGSMMCQVSQGLTAMDVAISLGMYLAQRNKSAFKDAYLTFNTNPKIGFLKGDSIRDIVNNLRGADWGGTTDLDKAFEALLNMAIKNNVPKEDMPKNLLVLSDMEFNGMSSWNRNPYGIDNGGAYKRAVKMFENAGYDTPNIVWWNIDSKSKATPVLADTTGTALVGGCSPSVIKNLCKGDFTPVDIFSETVMNKRYDLE